MNQRRVRVLPRIVPQASIGDLRRSRRGEYAAKPRQRGRKAQILGVHIFSGFTIKCLCCTKEDNSEGDLRKRKADAKEGACAMHLPSISTFLGLDRTE